MGSRLSRSLGGIRTHLSDPGIWSLTSRPKLSRQAIIKSPPLPPPPPAPPHAQLLTPCPQLSGAGRGLRPLGRLHRPPPAVHMQAESCTGNHGAQGCSAGNRLPEDGLPEERGRGAPSVLRHICGGGVAAGGGGEEWSCAVARVGRVRWVGGVGRGPGQGEGGHRDVRRVEVSQQVFQLMRRRIRQEAQQPRQQLRAGGRATRGQNRTTPPPPPPSPSPPPL